MVCSEAASCAEHVGSCSFLPALLPALGSVSSAPPLAVLLRLSTQKDVEFLLGQGTLPANTLQQIKLTTCMTNTFLLGKTSVIFVYFPILCDACLRIWDTKSHHFLPGPLQYHAQAASIGRTV